MLLARAKESCLPLTKLLPPESKKTAIEQNKVDLELLTLCFYENVKFLKPDEIQSLLEEEGILLSAESTKNSQSTNSLAISFYLFLKLVQLQNHVARATLEKKGKRSDDIKARKRDYNSKAGHFLNYLEHLFQKQHDEFPSRISSYFEKSKSYDLCFLAFQMEVAALAQQFGQEVVQKMLKNVLHIYSQYARKQSEKYAIGTRLESFGSGDVHLVNHEHTVDMFGFFSAIDYFFEDKKCKVELPARLERVASKQTATPPMTPSQSPQSSRKNSRDNMPSSRASTNSQHSEVHYEQVYDAVAAIPVIEGRAAQSPRRLFPFPDVSYQSHESDEPNVSATPSRSIGSYLCAMFTPTQASVSPVKTSRSLWGHDDERPQPSAPPAPPEMNAINKDSLVRAEPVTQAGGGFKR